MLNDVRIFRAMSLYIKAIAESYKEETADKTPIKPDIITRCGRLVKKPIKLDL